MFQVEEPAENLLLASHLVRYPADIDCGYPSHDENAFNDLKARYPLVNYASKYFASHLGWSEKSSLEVRDLMIGVLCSGRWIPWIEYRPMLLLTHKPGFYDLGEELEKMDRFADNCGMTKEEFDMTVVTKFEEA